jgi:hypothetical protein
VRTNALATPVPAKTPATGGRLGTAATSAGGAMRIPTAIVVTRGIFDNSHNLTNMIP